MIAKIGLNVYPSFFPLSTTVDCNESIATLAICIDIVRGVAMYGVPICCKSRGASNQAILTIISKPGFTEVAHLGEITLNSIDVMNS
jgi:hypothetical protein